MSEAESYSFGMLITALDGEPIATQLPFAFFSERGDYGSFFSHTSIDNPQVQQFAPHCLDCPLALVVFQGPHSYISPRWRGADGPTAPTWNYVAIHVYGRPRVIEDPREVRELLGRAVDQYEADMAQPWSLDELDEAYFQQRMTSMVAFDIPVERIETKARLGQKQSSEMNAELADWLEIQPDPMRRELARLLRASL